MTPAPLPSNEPEPSRRSMLGALLWGSLATALAPTLYVACSFSRPPRTAPASAVVGPESELGADAVRIVKVGLVDAIVMREGSGPLYALNLRCTHSGCTLRWHADTSLFICPCHGGRFDRNGAVVKGPPKVPLLKLPLTIDGGIVSVGDR